MAGGGDEAVTVRLATGGDATTAATAAVCRLGVEQTVLVRRRR